MKSFAKVLPELVAAKQVAAVGATKFFISIFLFFSLSILAQNSEPKKLPPAEVQLIYSYYMQDGDNSAVTGGTGTQELDYHGPAILVYVPVDSNSQISVKGGIDIYSSASQDNIDFNVSSASAQDARTHINLGYSSNNSEKETGFGVHSSFSIESDYTSFGIGGFFSKGFNNYSSGFSLAVQSYFDDCRWGRLSDESQLILIYPFELRGINWEDKFMRYTNSVSLTYNQTINKRMNLGVFLDGVWQTGLLSTTFHRVYFYDQQEHAIEKLPYNRWKLPIGVRVNYFATRYLLLRSYLRFYADNWGLTAYTLEIEPTFKTSPFFSIYPFYRFYQQSAVYWFKPFGQHSIFQDYYTSDYDLSAFNAHKFGLGFQWHPLNGVLKHPESRSGWQSIELRMGSYLRQDGLHAMFLSTILKFGG